MPVSHYQLLEIQDNASLEEIKAAYKKQALIFHPDKSKTWTSAEQFTQCAIVFNRISAAYEVLSDVNKRQNYDSMPKFMSTILNSQEKTFYQQWISLKQAYVNYVQRNNDPHAYIKYLHSQLSEVKATRDLLSSQLDKFENDTVNFYSIFQHYKQEKEVEISGLTKINQEMKRKLQSKESEMSQVANENQSLLNRIAELDRKNLELQNLESQRQLKKQQSRSADTIDANLRASNQSLSATPLTLFANNNGNITDEIKQNEKFKPTGLIAIYKMIDDDVLLKKEIFEGIKLVLENKELADNFRDQLHQYLNEKHIHVFRLKCSYHYDYMWEMNFMNCPAYYESNKYPEKIGELLLRELDKYIDISNIPQEFRKGFNNRAVTNEEDIPLKYRQHFRVSNVKP